MKIMSPVPVTAAATSLTEKLAAHRHAAAEKAKRMQQLADEYWQAAEEEAQHNAIVAEIEEQIEQLESMVKSRGGDVGEGKKAKRRHKKFDRLCACQHRSNGLASMSDASHVKLVIKSRKKARRQREADKPTSQIRRARLRAQEQRGLNPAEILPLPVRRADREAYFAELAEQRRVATIAACTCPHLVAANLNGECHDHMS